MSARLPFNPQSSFFSFKFWPALTVVALALCALLVGCGGGSPNTGGSGGSSTPPPAVAPSNLVYAPSALTVVVGRAISAIKPTVTGSVTSYSINPALPMGLSIDSATGTISGTPATTSQPAGYTVTASNAAGSTSCLLEIAALQLTEIPPPPSELTYPASPMEVPAGYAFGPFYPTVKGVVTLYGISPALSPSATLNPFSGVISGSFTKSQLQADYTITASNAGGSVSTVIKLGAFDTNPSITYPQTSIIATTGSPIEPDVPVLNGNITSLSVQPALPAGLNFDPHTGTISGTPTSASPITNYSVTATNATSTTTAGLRISVGNGPKSSKILLELGHGSPILSERMTSNRMLTEDRSGHWVLWDYNSSAILASGDRAVTTTDGDFPDPNQIDMSGQLAVISTSTELQVLSAIDGRLLFKVPAAIWWKLATDGSYLCTGSDMGVTVWSPGGQSTILRSGDYRHAKAFAAPTQVQVALGAAGYDVIETLSVPSGSQSVSAKFSGNFYAWFTDGQRFLTNLSDTFWEYSSAGMQQGIVALPPGRGWVTGQGNWIWFINSSQLQIYAVGSSNPTTTYSLLDQPPAKAVPSGMLIGLVGYPKSSIIDLSGALPSKVDYPVPAILGTWLYNDQILTPPQLFAAVSNTQWVIGNDLGVLFDGASQVSSPRYFGYGAALSIAGGGNTAAIATATGPILIYDVTGPTLKETINFPAGKLALSSDGSVLGASGLGNYDQYYDDKTLNFYSLPSTNVISTFPSFSSAGSSSLVDFSLSGSGTTIGRALGSPDSIDEVSDISGSPVIWSSSGARYPIWLSPDGSLQRHPHWDTISNVNVEIYKNGTLTTAVSGSAEGWIDNNRFLAGSILPTNAMEGLQLSGSTIYSSRGSVLTTLPGSRLTNFPGSDTLPQIFKPLFPTPDSVYDASGNAIYSLTTGSKTWQGPIWGSPLGYGDLGGYQGAISGSYVVYSFGNRVMLYGY